MHRAGGHLPTQIDAMEVWQAAAALGVAADPAAGRDLLRERVDAAAGKRPPPRIPANAAVPPTLLRDDLRVGDKGDS